jgi:hypothetical protein
LAIAPLAAHIRKNRDMTSPFLPVDQSCQG